MSITAYDKEQFASQDDELNELRVRREQVARSKLQSAAVSLASSLEELSIDAVLDEAPKLAAKDKKHFGDTPACASLPAHGMHTCDTDGWQWIQPREEGWV